MAVDRYDGPVELGQVFTCPDNDGQLGFRRVRVVARMPDERSDILILEELPGRIRNRPPGDVFKCPELNLRIVFRPEED